ncbi:uncharacterized protein [Physcomitrium patens]|uniref:uncharacterized protein n=1 Tax=Physcomitrium patens TaxID=3218 RepID=UPI00024AEE13
MPDTSSMMGFGSFFAAALAVSSLCIVVGGQLSQPGTDHGIMSIKNNLPYQVTIICESNVEKKPSFHAVAGASLQFDFDTKQHLQWACSFQSEGPQGSFVMWRSPASGGPGYLCIQVCQWRANLQGLSVLRTGGNTALVYLWH